MTKDFKQASFNEKEFQPSSLAQTDSFINNFKGGNRIQRGGGWTLKGGGTNTSSFLSAMVNYSIIPSSNNTYSLGSSAYKFSDIYSVKINNVTPLTGTKVYYVSDSSGGVVNRKLTFVSGILQAET